MTDCPTCGESAHKRAQRESRERKKEAQEETRRQQAEERSMLGRYAISKAQLLKYMQQEGLAPERATRIISSGHWPDEIIVMVAGDPK